MSPFPPDDHPLPTTAPSGPAEVAPIAEPSGEPGRPVGLDALRRASGDVPSPAARVVDLVTQRWPAVRGGAERWRPIIAVIVAVLFAGAGAMWFVRGDDAARPGPSLPMASRTGAGAAVPGSGSRRPGGGPPNGDAGGPAGTSEPPSWAAIAGAVARPGLYPVGAGTRLSALIAAAGGFTVDADPDRVNLAAVVRDGERVWVPRRGDTEAPAVIAGGANGGGASPGSAGRGGAPSGPVNLNTASAEELDRLPGVGPATAAAIIEHRTASGPFSSVEDLAAVRGIGPAKLEQLRPLVTV